MNIVPTEPGAPWQSKVAYGAALLFTLTSAGTNALYGWHRGTDLPSALIWLTVSIAASIVFSLSVPALLNSIAAKKFAQVLLVCVGLATCGSYSIVAALGSASGGRIDAAASEAAGTDARRKAQAAYDKATADLAALKPTRPLAELEALVSAPPPCRIVVTTGNRQTVCAHPVALTSELGRAKRRAELEAKIEAARLELSAPTTRQANSDAAAIAGYLGALGWSVDPEALNKVLALLAVLVVELGGGASLAIGVALASHSTDNPSATGGATVAPDRVFGSARATGCRRAPAPSTPTEHERATMPSTAREPKQNCGEHNATSPSASCEHNRAPPPRTAREHVVTGRDHKASGARFLAHLAERGGLMVTNQRAVAKTMGWSRSWAHAVLHDLADAGVIQLRTGKSGTVVKLVPHAASRQRGRGIERPITSADHAHPGCPVRPSRHFGT
jgi:DNA-binding IclR family transcriptional regulator